MFKCDVLLVFNRGLSLSVNNCTEVTGEWYFSGPEIGYLFEKYPWGLSKGKEDFQCQDLALVW